MGMCYSTYIMTCQGSLIIVANHNTTTHEKMSLPANTMLLLSYAVQATKPSNQVDQGASMT